MTDATTMQPKDAWERVGAGRAWIVDVREPDEYRREHIAGTVLCPTSTVAPTDFPAARPDTNMLVICRSGSRSGRIVDALRAAGRTDAVSVQGGMVAWANAGLPVAVNRRVPIPLMRQSMLAAGLLVVAFTVLAYASSPWWLLGTAFVGTGLTVAGSTGFCGMALILARMPWNRAR